MARGGRVPPALQANQAGSRALMNQVLEGAHTPLGFT